MPYFKTKTKFGNEIVWGIGRTVSKKGKSPITSVPIKKRDGGTLERIVFSLTTATARNAATQKIEYEDVGFFLVKDGYNATLFEVCKNLQSNEEVIFIGRRLLNQVEVGRNVSGVYLQNYKLLFLVPTAKMYQTALLGIPPQDMQGERFDEEDFPF